MMLCTNLLLGIRDTQSYTMSLNFDVVVGVRTHMELKVLSEQRGSVSFVSLSLYLLLHSIYSTELRRTLSRHCFLAHARPLSL